MSGVITGRHVLAHPYIVVHEYGWKCLAAAVVCIIFHRRVTWLSLVVEYSRSRACSAT
jgi:hypothetical protein